MEEEATAKTVIPNPRAPSPVDSVMQESPPFHPPAWDALYQAFFSTNGGKVKPRPALRPAPSLIVRSDLKKDIASYILDLRRKWPHFCNSIIYAPWDVRLFFDEFDFEEKGGAFCFDVIETMRGENQRNLIEFCKSWSNAHQHHFSDFHTLFAQPLEKVFHLNDLERFGTRFLSIALTHMLDTYRSAPGHWENGVTQYNSQMIPVSAHHIAPLNASKFHKAGNIHIAGMHRVRDTPHNLKGDSPKAAFSRPDANTSGPYGSSSHPHRIASHHEQMMELAPSVPFEQPGDLEMQVGMHPYMTGYVPITASNFHHPIPFGHVPLPARQRSYTGSNMIVTQQASRFQVYEYGPGELPRNSPFATQASGSAAFDGQGIAPYDPHSTHHPPQCELRHDSDQYAHRGNFGQGRVRRNSGTRGARGRGYHSNNSTRRSSGGYVNGVEHDSVGTQGRRFSNDGRDGAWKSENDRSSRHRQAYAEQQVVIEEEISAHVENRMQQSNGNIIEGHQRVKASKKVDPNSEDSKSNSQYSAISTRVSSGQETFDPQRESESDHKESLGSVNGFSSGRPSFSNSRALLVGPKFIGEDVENVNTLFVAGFPEGTSAEELSKAFSSIASVSDVKFRKTAKIYLCAFVTFFSTADARKVLSASRILCQGKDLTVEVQRQSQTASASTFLRHESPQTQSAKLDSEKDGSVLPSRDARTPEGSTKCVSAIHKGKTTGPTAGNQGHDPRITVYSSQDARSGLLVSQPANDHPNSPLSEAPTKPLVKTWASVASAAKAGNSGQDLVQAKPTCVTALAAQSRPYMPADTPARPQEKNTVASTKPSSASLNQSIAHIGPTLAKVESSRLNMTLPAKQIDTTASENKRVPQYQAGQSKKTDTAPCPTVLSQPSSNAGKITLRDWKSSKALISASSTQALDSTAHVKAANQQDEEEHKTQQSQVQPSECHQPSKLDGSAVQDIVPPTTEPSIPAAMDVSNYTSNPAIETPVAVSNPHVDSSAKLASSTDQQDGKAFFQPADTASDNILAPANGFASPVSTDPAASALPVLAPFDCDCTISAQHGPVSTGPAFTNRRDSVPTRAKPKSKTNKKARKQSSENLAKENQKPHLDLSSPITTHPESRLDTATTHVAANETPRPDVDLSTTMHMLPGAFPSESQALPTSEISACEVETRDIPQTPTEPTDIEHTAKPLATITAPQQVVQADTTKWVLSTLDLADWTIDHAKVQNIIKKLPESDQDHWSPQAEFLQKQLQVAQDKLADNAKKLENSNKTTRKKLQRVAKGIVESYSALMTELQLFCGKVANLNYQKYPKVDSTAADPLRTDHEPKHAGQFDNAKKEYYKGKRSYETKMQVFSPPGSESNGIKPAKHHVERPYARSLTDDSSSMPTIDGVLARSRTIDLSKMRDGAGENPQNQIVTIAPMGNDEILICYDRDDEEIDTLLDQGRDITSADVSTTSGLSSATSSVVNGSPRRKQTEMMPMGKVSPTRNEIDDSKNSSVSPNNGLGIFNITSMPQSPTQRPQSPTQMPQSPKPRPSSPMNRPISPPGASRSPGPMSYARVAAIQTAALDKGKGKAKEVVGDGMGDGERTARSGWPRHGSVSRRPSAAAVAGKSRAPSSVRSDDGYANGNGRHEDDWKPGPEGPWGKSGFQARGG